MIIKIGDNRYIGEDQPCYIIMDVGANHNGDLETAKQLIKIAAEMGADAIKFQTYTADKLYSKKTPKFEQDPILPYDMITKCQHPREWLPILNNFAKENNIDFSSSPFDYEAVDLLEDINVPFYKIASPEIVDLELIDYIAKKQKPVIISTALANIEEIEDAVKTVQKNNNNQIILLHCNILYPTPVHVVNLKAIETLQKTFEFPIGFSDHTQGIHISLAAVTLGATMIEKHLTLDRSQKGPDHGFALEPQELEQLVKKIRDIEKGEQVKDLSKYKDDIKKAMGSGIKEPHELETEEKLEKARRSIIAAQDIPEGTVITREMLIVKRPGYGIKPKDINNLIGRKTKIAIEEDQWITWDMV